MKFKIQKKEHSNVDKYHKNDLDIAYKFAGEMYKEFSTLIKAMVLFGSTARMEEKPDSDIDIMIILDDVTVMLTPELTTAYKIIAEKVVEDISKRLHITTMRFSTFWEYVRAGDPVGINILRDGVALIDSNFFTPMQILLAQGRVRPTPESTWTYFAKAPRTLNNSKWHIFQATIDLYWAVIDSAHAALMKAGEVPPSPFHVADILEEKLVKTGKIEAKYVRTMRKFYTLMKDMNHRKITEISGREFDILYVEADTFVKRMKMFIDKG